MPNGHNQCVQQQLTYQYNADLVFLVVRKKLFVIKRSCEVEFGARMAFNPPDFIGGCEVLERALKLLQEECANSLGPDLQLQIDEILEEIAPHWVLELLALPLDDAYRTKREKGLHGVRNILWAVGGGGTAVIAGGSTSEDFMNEAFLFITVAEQVDLFVATSSNIPTENFEVYEVALTLVAQAFLNKKPYLIRDADYLFQQLQQTKLTTL